MDNILNNAEEAGDESFGSNSSYDQIETQDTEAAMSQRRSTRERKAPEWLKDYVVNTIVIEESCKSHDSSVTRDKLTSYTPHTFPYSVSKSLNKACVNFLTNISAVYEPHTYDQARRCDEWVQAM